MSGLFGGKTPKPTPTPEMPVPDDAAAKAADLRQRQMIASRSGRASTMLSRQNSGSAAGTQSYGNSLLGQAG
ncbi:hypothetical protein EN866_33255 [Mesorhizobium sp. M2D.F.Ca.ET.223.01.1.1]|uniref:hypothetical protein n=1 Tax=Mesorhizobium sp. M2D.F.Ca.ET.223.01.1.1 TaxID=2563940 RepID=UPI001091EEF5|nr:hypothetical protein [Mesorhizobium sp. M2D.F.Ca.ET.223.01.1.1]TGR84533.1 hypothetical protein EN866_33255 [Mesorhizobium sp. M2D.F.Ca.ET.223.01.1.1]TGT65305.1 hypothetical protein EN802_32010 [bacterium M00.F.Ca.ET.159.01.1.1]TGT79416.1 hypothetical protein EN800_31350 [bacterium M00.F.Ca.ET.157.01.1.1]